MDKALQVALEEFRAMHAQILERSRLQQHVIWMGAVLGAAVLALLASILVPDVNKPVNYKLASYLVLILTFPFLALSWAYAYQDYMIGATARFIHKVLRLDLRRLAQDEDLIKNEIWFVHVREKSKPFIIGWFSFHSILLFFPFLLLAAYSGLIISKLYIPATVDLRIQIILVILNIVIVAIVSLSGRIGEYTIRKAGKAFEQEMGRQPNNSQRGTRDKPRAPRLRVWQQRTDGILKEVNMNTERSRIDLMTAWRLLKELWVVGSLPLVFSAIGFAAMIVPDTVLASGEQDVVSKFLFSLAALVFVGNSALGFYRWKKIFETFARQNEIVVSKVLDEAIRLCKEGAEAEQMIRKLKNLVETLNSIGLSFQRFALEGEKEAREGEEGAV